MCKNVDNNVCEIVTIDVCRDVEVKRGSTVQKRVCENVDNNVCEIVTKDVCQDVKVKRCGTVQKRVCENVAKPRTVEKRVEDCDCRKVCRNVIMEKKCGLGQALVPKNYPIKTTTEKTLPLPWTGFGKPKSSETLSGFGKATRSKTPRWNIVENIRTFFHETLPNKFKFIRA